ncbi:baculoviral IAP repeat-containing protein 2 [Pelodiscus sinensis]|uniref:Inhibitor of apoptosis protein n=1 Tax=Pelodiscus sinensis TaxID=13735 RepID=K7FUR7_PELSI|nr:inhibitor of apoptosis protein [Pelodiscus sinensis]XP_014425935.1 inhibitor of apoptosis protein [Pelodiscus sinensis]XP_014425943.1 inhibitor of apoptosis protein [Pelodiscus sinensis]XP_025037388.1 inhibitor of apoptosis protein [Pelodiscus sinensis]XP_025037394.1 inhibitor of apoptosis protein [Pelodiscus sinensis]|eukprot:XP_014425926.1 inhibitor of apoptosis protein [Pelodiscus sinensis]
MNIVESSSFLASLMNNSTVCELKYELSCELYRMSTFSTFPVNVPVSERSLARAGFYYTGVKDKVKCFSCGLMLDNWKQGDNAMEKHKQLYPSCSYIQNLTSVSNLGSSSYSAFSPPATINSLSPSLHSITMTPSLEQFGYYSTHFSSFPQEPLTSGAAEDPLHLRVNFYNPGMSAEAARLRTFHTWPLTFLSPTDLAKAGFYYIGPADKVACFTCGGQLSNWEPKDNAMAEHRRYFPNCPFVENQTRDQQTYSISNQSMQTCVARVKTFMNWPTRIPVRPEQLAAAGFYYVGRNDDVKCFCCDGGLRCWESGDDPWIEHAKWFPRCEYLLGIKGREFVNQIQARFPHLLEQLLSTSDTPVDESADPSNLHSGSGDSHSEDAIMMNTPVVKAALEMGFSRRLIKQTVQSKILATEENYKTINELVSDLLTAEDEKREEEKERQSEEVASDDLSLIRKNRLALFQRLTCVLPVLESLLSAKVISELEHDVIKQKTQTPLQARELIDTILVKGNEAALIFRNCLRECDPILYKDLFVEKNIKYVPTEDTLGLPIEEQLRRLQEERTCKVCMDKEVSIVFIPCGHLVVCKECAPSLRKCPICRGTIKGTVRTFLS